MFSAPSPLLGSPTNIPGRMRIISTCASASDIATIFITPADRRGRHEMPHLSSAFARGDGRSLSCSEPMQLNVHFDLVVPDGVFVDAEERLVFAPHPVPISADVLAILDRIV